MDNGTSILELISAAVISGGVVSAVVGTLFKGFVTKVEAEVKSHRTWKEESVAELLGPLYLQIDRIQRIYF